MMSLISNFNIRIKNTLKYLKSIINLIIINKFEKNFINHNYSLFSKPLNKENLILIEMIGSQANHIAVSYLSGVLAKIHDAKIIGYNANFTKNIFQEIKLKITNYKKKKIFESFGMTEILYYHTSKKNKDLANHLRDKLIPLIKSKSDLENLKVDNILVGDLIYDQYLRFHMVPTIDIHSAKFKRLMFDFCFLYLYWRKVLLKKNVKALIVSHACYFTGLTARIAIEFDIPAYQATLENIYYLTKDNPYPSSEFHSYKKDFEKLDIKIKNRAIKKAHERLELIFKGSVDVDQRYIKNSAYHKKYSDERILQNKSPVKVLIAPHCFFDSPHGIGRILFPDFYEWLDFICKLSIKTDYEWYIKTHPKTFIENKIVVKDFVSRFPNIRYLSDEVSHNQLINEGINIVLTVYGSIGLEYAARKKTVINASMNNPRISFDFNIHPKSKEELKNIILNLKKYINHNIILEDVYKCYYMKYLNYKQDIFIKDFKTEINKIGGYYNSLFTPKIYDFWIKYWSTDIHSQINNSLKKFLLSGEYKMKSNWN